MFFPLAMQLPQTFIPTAREVGLLAMMTEICLTVAMFSFLGAFVFFLSRGNSVHPSHRAAGGLTAVICLIAGVAYWYIRYYFHDVLHQVAITNDPAGKRVIIRDAFFAIGQYRYMDWLATTPLLLLKTVLSLKVKPREIVGWIALLLGADVWMVLAGSIGDQQFSPEGALLVRPHLLWGTLSTLGYLVIPYVLLVRLGPRYGGWADDESGHAFRVMAFATITTWGVYPLGYLVPVIFPRGDFNWVHLAFTIADLVNKIGVGVVAYLAGAEALARRVPPESVQPERLSTLRGRWGGGRIFLSELHIDKPRAAVETPGMEIAIQLALFLENQPGTLAAVCDELAAASINILALTISDTVDHSVVRMIVSDTDKALNIFEEHGTLVVENEVLLIEIDNKPGSLSRIAHELASAEVNIEYAYLATGHETSKGLMVLRLSDAEKALELLQKL